MDGLTSVLLSTVCRWPRTPISGEGLDSCQNVRPRNEYTEKSVFSDDLVDKSFGSYCRSEVEENSTIHQPKFVAIGGFPRQYDNP
jgi:hypothetical protein